MIFDFVHVLQGECTLKQALIKDKRNPNLYLLAASQTKDKTALTVDGVGKMLQEMRQEFDFVLCDSPAGIESGAQHAMYFADDAIIVTNPELSSCRDSDKMIGFISSRSKRAELGRDPVRQSLLVTRCVCIHLPSGLARPLSLPPSVRTYLSDELAHWRPYPSVPPNQVRPRARGEGGVPAAGRHQGAAGPGAAGRHPREQVHPHGHQHRAARHLHAERGGGPGSVRQSVSLEACRQQLLYCMHPSTCATRLVDP